jgi:hypothetical protein
MLRNDHRTGFAGLFLGGTAIVGSVAAFFKLLAQPTYLVHLGYAIAHLRYHVTTDADDLALAQLCAALFAVVGSLCVGFLLAYFGRPATVASDPKSSDASAPGISPAAPPAVPHNAVASPAKPEETDHA